MEPGGRAPAQEWDLEALPVAAALLVGDEVVACNQAAARLGPACRLGAPLTTWFDDPGPLQDGPRAMADGPGWVDVHLGAADELDRRIVVLRECTNEILTRAALDGVADSTFVLDHAGRPRWRSERLRQRSGTPDSEALRSNPSERIHPEDLPLVLDTFVDATPDRPSRVVVRSRAVDDDDRWQTIEVVVHHRLDDALVRGYLVQVHNLDEGVELKAGLADADPAWMSLTEVAPVGIVVTDVVGELVYRNSAARALLGPDLESLGHEGRWLDLARPDDRPTVRSAFEAALRDGSRSEVTAAFSHPDGGWRWLRLVATPQPTPSGQRRGLIATLEDVTEQTEARAQLEAAEARLRHLADHDHLTGLPNRSSITEQLQRAVEEHRAGGTGLAVLFCDLDGFKPINDRYGHRSGDLVLAEVADRLRRAAAGSAMVSRLGGDEFLLLWQAPIDDALHGLAERLHEHVSAPLQVEGDAAALTASVGIAVAEPGVDIDPETLIRVADQAMYEAKAAGVGRTVVREIEAQAPSA
ncbi:MAG: diguanylate cyclase domain-containing protein [Acidimicrobiales bacterium]